jgi:hypothetical protein
VDAEPATSNDPRPAGCCPGRRLWLLLQRLAFRSPAGGVSEVADSGTLAFDRRCTFGYQRREIPRDLSKHPRPVATLPLAVESSAWIPRRVGQLIRRRIIRTPQRRFSARLSPHVVTRLTLSISPLCYVGRLETFMSLNREGASHGTSYCCI